MAELAQFGMAVLGGAVGAVLTQVATFYRDWLNKREDGKFTALTLALQLEAYASSCIEPIYALDNYASSKHQTVEPDGSLPSLPEFSEKTNWRSLGTRSAAAVLGFRVRVNNAHSLLGDVWRFDGSTAAWGQASDAAIELGFTALDVAQQLRRTFGLGPAPRHGSFDANKFFSEKHADLTTRRERARKSAGEMWSLGGECLS